MNTRTRVGALIAAVAVAGGVVCGAGPVSAAPPDSLVSKVGKGFAAVVEDNIDSLCLGKEDTGEPGDDEPTTTTTPSTTTPAPSTSTAPDSPPTGCDINSADLQKAAEKCLPSGGKDKATTEEVSADKDEFLKCMAEEGFGKPDEDEETDDETKSAVADLSLARISESLTAFYVNSLSPDGNNGDRGDEEPATGSEGPTASGDADATGLPAWSSLLSTGATAGAFIAAPNKEKQESSSWILGAGDAKNDAALDVRALDRSNAPQAVDQGVEQYALYGATLNALGLDSSAAKDEGSSGFRYMSGTALMAAYTAAGAVDAVFDAVLGVLQKLNPFSWMADALRDAGTPASYTEGMKGNASYSDDSGTFDEIKAFLSRFFLLLLDFSWGVTIPLLIGFTIIALLLSRKKSPGSRLKTLGIRVAFVAIGLPLIGGLYTGVLGGLAGGADDAASSNATKVVLSTVVDFQAWADQRLGLPEDAPDLVWDRAIDGPTARTVADGRRAALAINAQIRPEWKKFGPKAGDEGVEWNESMMDGELAEANPQESRNPFGSTLDLLKRYTSGEQISAGAYETGVKRGLTEAAANGRGQVVLKWVTDLTDPSKLAKMTAEDVSKMQNPLIGVLPDRGLAGEPGTNALDMKFKSGTDAYCPSWKVVADGWDGKSDPLTGCNMSPMSMFNYLNTSWDGSTGVKLFSPRDSSSAYARDQHMSANLHGGGAMQAVYWFSAMTLLVSFALIGFLYAFGLMTAMVRRVVTILGAAPFALLGFTGGIAKVIVAATSALVEIVGTLVIYRMMTMLMMIVPTLLERPLSARASSIDGDEAVGLAGAGMGLAIEAFDNPKTAVMVIALVASIGVIIFTMVAVKTRSALIQGFDAAMSRVLNKFLETDVGSGADAQPGALRQGLTRGAGMAATSAIMRGGGGGGDDAGGGAPGGEGGEGGVEQGTGEGVPGAGDGSMSVDADGDLMDRAGNPVKNADGSAATAAGLLGGDGPLTDGTGGEIIGTNGSPLTADDVTGFGPNGEVMGADGQLTDNNGNPLTNANAAQAAGTLAGQKAMADRVAAQGLSNQEGSAGVPVGALGNFGGVAPASAPVETSAAPRPGNLRADGDGSGVKDALAMGAVQAAQQRLSGAGRGQGTLARTVRESMSGKSSGGQGGGGGTGMTGLPKTQRPAGSGSGTTAITAATAGMMPKRGGVNGD